ncbi:hypothetical protein G5C51_35580 [Streptomyces sp. A7024]|uniref:Uncharacterized protein n=1 Tax=Streptomyces coryli TaxID=1128680 RepID=A0A6G4UAC5_9ACTN|nr:hypothetical protein [Streptomyces coryli]NGN69195.1 hypothetical protein [Streptomyces coryli]
MDTDNALTPERISAEILRLEALRETTVQQLAAHTLPAGKAVRRIVAVQHDLRALRERAMEQAAGNSVS